MFQDRIAHGFPALYETEILSVAAPKLLYVNIAREGCCPVAILHTFVFLVPVCHEFVALLPRSVRHEEHDRRRCVIVKEPLLELRSILINLDLISDAFGCAEAAHERVVRIQLLHHEHIIDRHSHCDAAR